jgi:hypothetical protein
MRNDRRYTAAEARLLGFHIIENEPEEIEAFSEAPSIFDGSRWRLIAWQVGLCIIVLGMAGWSLGAW